MNKDNIITNQIVNYTNQVNQLQAHIEVLKTQEQIIQSQGVTLIKTYMTNSKLFNNTHLLKLNFQICTLNLEFYLKYDYFNGHRGFHLESSVFNVPRFEFKGKLKNIFSNYDLSVDDSMIHNINFDYIRELPEYLRFQNTIFNRIEKLESKLLKVCKKYDLDYKETFKLVYKTYYC